MIPTIESVSAYRWLVATGEEEANANDGSLVAGPGDVVVARFPHM